MEFEFDPEKARENLKKHDVSFELAMRVWADPLYRIAFDRTVRGEERWHAIGRVGSKLLIVSHTLPDPRNDRRIRIISAREAEPWERRDYEETDF